MSGSRLSIGSITGVIRCEALPSTACYLCKGVSWSWWPISTRWKPPSIRNPVSVFLVARNPLANNSCFCPALIRASALLLLLNLLRTTMPRLYVQPTAAETTNAFCNFTKTKNCLAEGAITRQLSRRVAVGSSCMLCDVVGHLSCLVASHLLRSLAFAAGADLANYQLNNFEASWPIASTDGEVLRPPTPPSNANIASLASGPHSASAPMCPPLALSNTLSNY